MSSSGRPSGFLAGLKMTLSSMGLNNISYDPFDPYNSYNDPSAGFFTGVGMMISSLFSGGGTTSAKPPESKKEITHTDIFELKKGIKRNHTEMEKPQELEPPPKKRTVRKRTIIYKNMYDSLPESMRDGYYVVKEGDEVVEQAFFENGIRNGLTITKYGNGELFRNYEKGIANGAYLWREESHLQFGQYKDGKAEDSVTDIMMEPLEPGDEEKKMRKIERTIIGQYHEGKKHGTNITINGSLPSEMIDWKDDRKHGESYSFDADGKGGERREYRYDKLNGECRTKTGKCYYVDGIKHGPELNKLSSEVTYYFEGKPCHKDHYLLYRTAVEKELQKVYRHGDRVFSPEAIAQITDFLLPECLDITK